MNTVPAFDVIVIGVGSMGAPACYHLARTGYKVLGLEQFSIVHEFGSHAGQSRLIRKAYFEHSDYVPLLERAYENWKALENETGEQVYYQTGLVYFGDRNAQLVKGTSHSAGLYDIALEPVDEPTAKKKYPQFTLPIGIDGVFEPAAGFLTPEKAISLYAEQARLKGAQIHTNEKVLSWEKTGDAIVVTTDKNTYRAAKLIITAGAWSGKLIPDLAATINVTRQFIAWIRPKRWDDFLLGNFPCWLMADDQEPGCFYGFPVLPAESFGEPYGMKIAYHYPGEATDPDRVDRTITEKDRAVIRYALEKYFPAVFESIVAEKICLYSNTPDENFIIDLLPGFEDRVVIACGFSGHGFKFAPVVGEIVAELATTGKTKFSIDFLRVGRFTNTV